MSDYSTWCGGCCPECGWHNLHTAWCSQAQRVIPTTTDRPSAKEQP